MDTGAGTRKLFYIPIVHTPADMGALGSALQTLKTSTVGRQRVRHGTQIVDRLWDEIENAIYSLAISPGTRIYQDGLPVCGHESRIVSDLARTGSRNHRLLLWLQSQGAKVMGTESADLLVEEYEITKAALVSNSRSKKTSEAAARSLLEKRDRFIAGRIDDTLMRGEAGILFLGMLHSVQLYLPKDIQVIFPVKALSQPAFPRNTP